LSGCRNIDGFRAIPVPDSVLAAAPRIDALVHQALTARSEVTRLLEQAKTEGERLVLC
jgi:hypothetical protein